MGQGKGRRLRLASATGPAVVGCTRLDRRRRSLAVLGGPRRSQPVRRALVGSARPLVGETGAVALEHGGRAPAGEPLEVTGLPAGGQILVGERVPELVRMEPRESRVLAAPSDD